MKISVAILSKPNDAQLAECISSLDWADEIVVGSCGKNAPIEAIDQYIEFPKDLLDAYGFAYARNRIAEKCTGDWIVTVDTDEIFECSRDSLEAELSNTSANAMALVRYGTGHEESQWRIHRNNAGILWRGIIHEELHQGDSHVSECSAQSSARIFHNRHKGERLLHAELLCRAFDLHELRSTTAQHWFDEVHGNNEEWRTRQHAYWLRRKVLNLHPCHVNPYATHVPILYDLITKQQERLGRKLKAIELGCGMNSTPMLSMATELKSYEGDAQWAHLMKRFGTEFISHYSDANAEGCDIAFIDGAFLGENTQTRREQVERLADVVPFIVCHDTEAPIYGYQHCLPKFKYKYTDMRLVPWTTVVSNSEDLSFLGGGICEYVPTREVL